nr:PREDICTED: protein lethal(2)denticleless [Bemisia tabaci]
MLVSKLLKRTEGFRDSWNYDLAIKRLGLIQCRSEPPLQTAPIFCCKFCPTPGLTDILAYADEEGKVFILNTKSEENFNSRRNRNCDEVIASFVAHYNAIFDLAWSATSYRLLSASGDHAIHLWDVRTQECIAVFNNCKKSIKTVSFEPESDNVFAVGGRDGNIYVCDIRENPAHADGLSIECSGEIPQAHGSIGPMKRKRQNNVLPPRAESITNVCYQDEHHLISCADGDGLIKIWDLRNIRRRGPGLKPPQPYETLKHPGNNSLKGFTSLAVSPTGICLYASCYDSHIYCYNISTYDQEPMYSYTGHEGSSYYVKITLSPDGHYLLSGSKDSSAYIWRVDTSPWPIVTLPDHVGEVTAVAWSQDINSYFKIVACSDEPSPAIWRVETNITDKSSDLTVIRSAQTYEVPESAKIQPLPNLPLQYEKILKVLPVSEDPESKISFTECLPNLLYDKSHFFCREVKPRTAAPKQNWLTEITLNKLNRPYLTSQNDKKPKKLKISNGKNGPKTPKSIVKKSASKLSGKERKTSECHLSDSENSSKNTMESPKIIANASSSSSLTPAVNTLNLNLVTPERPSTARKEQHFNSQPSLSKVSSNQKTTPKSIQSLKGRRRKNSNDSRQINLLKYFQACSSP